ncbi:MAG: glycosyltransferase [Candidatus Omnitrophica bacterium]|nr:glycosyltransferase [Candidatus Omnitrophota bacterium]
MTRPSLTVQEELSRDTGREKVFLWMIVLWICLLLYFNPRLLALTYAAPDALSKAAVVIFTLCLDSIWFYTLYHIFMIGISWRLRRKYYEPPLPSLKGFPAVAVLYPTRNDFCPEAFESCLLLEYKNKHVFILDDSTIPDYQARIDRAAKDHSRTVTVIRRKDKKGYKAGNLNFTLRQIESQYPYFVVSDADGILPKNFIGDLLAYFEADSRIAFVQTCQKWNSSQNGSFAQALGFMIEAHYRYYVRARNRYGFVMFYGHGAILKTSVWKESGGFPELATEDLAYSSRVRRLGYQGIYTERVVCLEDFPAGLRQFRLRSEKWIRGTSEFLKKEYGEFARSSQVPWFEKADVLINAGSHYQSAVMLVFLLMLGTLLPAYFNHFRYPGSFFLMPVAYGKSPVDYLFHIRYHIFWSLDFYVVMVASIFCPLVPAIVNMYRKPATLIRYVALSTCAFFSCLIVETLDVLVFLATGRAIFRNTQDAALERNGPLPKPMTAHFFPNHPAVFIIELSFAASFFGIGLLTKNLWFFAPAAGLALSPMICNLGWEQRWVRGMSYLPFVITIVIVVLVTLDVLMAARA